MKKKPIPVEPGLEWTVDRFCPDDAQGVVDLFSSVYGANYPVRTYMEPDLLKKENQEGRVISSVARLPSGAVVGHNALFNSAPNPRIFESGAGLVHPLYRGGQGIFTQMVSHGIEVGMENPNVDLIFGEPVCNHPFSQKMMDRLKFPPRAMEVNLMPAAAYEKEKSASGRVSTLLAFRTIKPRPCKVFIPEGLTEQAAFCYQGMDDQRTFETAEGAPDAPETNLTAQVFDFAQVTRIIVSEAGKDFATRFGAEERHHLDRGIRVIQVWLNTGQRSVGKAVETLWSMGYFFGGVLPQWFGTDGLLMQKILDQPDWEGTVLEGDRPKALGAMVRQEWERV